MSWIILYPLAVVMIVLAVSNRGPVDIDLWPVPITVGVPLYALLFGAVFFGVVWGGLATWMSGSETRKISRNRAREIKAADSEINRLKKQINRLEEETRTQGQPPQSVQISKPSEKPVGLLPPADAA